MLIGLFLFAAYWFQNLCWVIRLYFQWLYKFLSIDVRHDICDVSMKMMAKTFQARGDSSQQGNTHGNPKLPAGTQVVLNCGANCSHKTDTVAGGRAAGEWLVSAWSRRLGPQQLAVAQALTSCQGLSDPLVSRCQHSRSADTGELVAIFSYMAGIVGNP